MSGALASSANSESLADAIALAYKTNPTLLAQRALLQVTDEAYVQARAGYRPQINVQLDGTQQAYSQQIESIDSADALITVQQSIYTGGRTATAIDAAEADILAGRESLRATEASVLAQVIQAYSDVVRDQEGINIAQSNLDALSRQMAQTEGRAKVHDLTQTDLSQAQGSFFQAQAGLANAQAQLDISRSAYEAIVGRRPDVLQPPPPLPNLPATLDEALTVGERGNPTLRSAQYAQEAARLRTAEANDQRLPSVSLRAQYGFAGPASPYRPNIYPPDATATITVTQPLFAGGVIASQMRQQLERQSAARNEAESARRTMVMQIRQAWSLSLAAQSNMINADKEVQADAAAYKGVQIERQADLRSTLEVLYIEQSLFQAELARAGAHHDAYVAQANLLSAVGLLEVERVLPNEIDRYDPQAAFNKVRRAGAVPWEIVPDKLDRLTAPPLHTLPTPP